MFGPAHPKSTNWSAPRLLAEALAVLSALSTIALDASLAKTPFAVIRCSQTTPCYENYRPLLFFYVRKDFLDNITGPEFYGAHKEGFSR